MAATLVQTNFYYQSSQGAQIYHFTLVLDQSGNLAVSEITTPTGLTICESTSSVVPTEVLDDIQIAIGQVRDLMAQTSAVNGQLTYASETSQSFAFVTNFSNTNYRVTISVSDFLQTRITNKTVSGFTVETSTPYTGTIGFDVFV